MNRFLKVGLTSLIAALAITSAGCKTRPKNLTNLPNSDARAGAVTELQPSNPIGTGIGNGGRLTVPPGNAGPVDLNPGRNPQDTGTGTPLPEDPFTGEGDRETLKANIVYFDYDKATVKKSEQPKLAAVAEYLKAHANAKLQIEGHCDERGTEGYNLALGERRALAVREALLGLGVPSGNVTTVSFGESRPADTGHDDGAWAKNRRAEFVLFAGSAPAVR